MASAQQSRPGRAGDKEAHEGHLEEPGQNSSESAQAEEETGKEDRPGAKLYELLLRGAVACCYPGNGHQETIDKRRSPIHAHSKAQNTSQRSRANRCEDRRGELHFPLIGEKSRKQDDGFPRQRKASVFQHHPEKHYPVTLMSKQFRQKSEEGMGHDCRDYARN